MFVSVWIYCRHYLNLCILWATVTEFKSIGPFDLDWDLQQYKCWISQYITFALLASLQAVNLFWLFLILRIAKNYVMRVGLADERSDDEDEGDETEGEQTGKKLLEGTKEADGRLGTQPVVLLNGKPVEGQVAENAKANGEAEVVRRSTREKKKNR